MSKFTEVFHLEKSQAEIDFIDVDLDTDTPLYICPYAIQIRNDEWSALCGDYIRSFFNEVLDQLRDGNTARVDHLLGNLHEPNETRLGQSVGVPSGRGVGEDKATMLGGAFRNSRAFETGLLSDISEAELFIYGVGRDTISDLATNVIRGLLAEYTLEQCQLYGIATKQVRTLGPIWNIETQNWEAKTLSLPVHKLSPILLVPKFSVRHRLSLDSQEFYNFHMVEFLQQEYLSAGSALVETLKNGRQRVTKKSVKEHHPFIKDDLASFVRNHPEVLDSYKELKGAQGPLEIRELDENFDERVFARVLIDRLQGIDAGAKTANEYHSVAMGICTFLFHPSLIKPVKEFEQHDGRKRVDIKFTNASENGFFFRMLSAPQTRAISVYLECKNYNRKIANPELDQLSGRFNVRQGHFGILLCRSMENRCRVIEGCRDTVIDGRGYMLPLADNDLVTMLNHVVAGNRNSIEGHLETIYAEIAE